MTRTRYMWYRIASIAPWLTAVVMLSFAAALPNRIAGTPQSQVRKAQLAQAMNDVPLLIDHWVGEDVPVPPEAQKLLRPNAILSRTYVASGGPALRLLIVHCSDARDMIGHYPPICYPSSGWIESPVGNADGVTINAGQCELPVRTYSFRRLRDRGTEDAIRIFNAFILPDGTVARSIDEIDRQSERLEVSVQGVAQLQVITAQELPLDRAVAAVNELLGGMTPLFDALRAGQGVHRGQK
jgi:hypothetical protein